MSTELAQVESPKTSAFETVSSFEHAQRVAKMLSSSSLIPKEYQSNIQNTMIALEMAHRTGASPLMVMQNLYIVHGKPSWSSSFVIAALNSSNRFEALRFEVKGEGDSLECFAWTYTKGEHKERIEGPAVTMKMAKAEGWVDKNGSKWKTMPTLMIRYRAAAFFGRLYAPEITMGMLTEDEYRDIAPIKNEVSLDEVIAVFEVVEGELTKPEYDNAKRIIEGKEKDSYGKLLEVLKSKAV